MRAIEPRLTTLFSRAKYISQTEGFIPLLRRGFTFLLGCFFRYRTYYLYYEDMLKEREEASFIPKIQDFTLKVITTNQQADELANGGLDLSSPFIKARYRLDKGAIAFCVFIDTELAHISWVAITEEAKKTLDTLPYYVDFSRDEAYASAVETKPKYRRLGLARYVYSRQLQFLKQRGIAALRFVAATTNIAPQRVCAELGINLYAEAHYLKILWWKSWKVVPHIGQRS